MDRVKQFGSTPEPRSYTPLTSRRASAQRDYSGGGNSWDKYSSRSGGSDYSSNKSGHISDYGGSNQSLYNSWDRKSSISGGRYGQQSRETSPVNVRAPSQHRQYDYSSSASPSPYSTYRSSSDAQSPSVQRKYERQSSRSSDVYDEPSRPRRRWEDDVYGAGKRGVSETLNEPVKPPPKDYSDSESDDSAPEDDKGHRLRYMTSRGTSPMREPDKREQRSRKETSSGIAKVKRVKCPQRDSRVRNSRSDVRRKRLVDCGIQTNLDESPPPRRRRGDGLAGSSREEVAKLAALALLKDDGGEAGGREAYEKYRDKFEQSEPPLSPGFTSGQKKQQTHQPYGSNMQKQNRNETPSRREPVYDDSVLDPPNEKSWRKSVYGNQTSNRDSAYDDNVLDVPNEKSWRKEVYGDQSPSPAVSPGLRRHQTQEDLRVSPNDPQPRHQTMTSTPISNHEYAEEHVPSKPERRSYTSTDGEKRHSRQSDSDHRRSKHESDTSQFRRSSSRDSMLDERPRRSRQRTSSRELLDEPEPKARAPPLTPDSLSLRDSIEKVHSWKQNLPPSVDTHLSVDTGQSNHPEIGFARSDDSGEYFSAQEHHQSSGRSSREPEVKYKDTMYAQRSPTSPVKRRDIVDTTDDEVLSPGGARRRRNRKQLSRELSTDSVFNEDDYEDHSHHPILKTYRKSDLNRSLDLERINQEELERRQRIYSGIDDAGELPPRTEIHKRSGSSSDAFSRDESPNRRRGYGKRGSSRSSSRELLDERRPRKVKSEVEQLTSDSSTFGFNREGSPNRPSSRSKRPSRPNSRENVLDENDVQTYQDPQYIRPHSMVVSNESLANLSAAGSIASMNSAMTDDGTLRNSASMQSMISNEIQEQPPLEHFSQSNIHKSLDSSGSGSPLPDIVPGEKDRKLSKKNKLNGGFIGGTQDIDNLLNFSPNEEEFVEKGKQPVDDVIKSTRPHLLDAPVPRQPSPIKPLHAEEEKLIDIDEPSAISPVQNPHQEPPTRDNIEMWNGERVTSRAPEQRIPSPHLDPRMLSPSPDPRLSATSPEPRLLTPSPDSRIASSKSDSRMTTPSSDSRKSTRLSSDDRIASASPDSRMSSQTPDSSRKTSSPLYSRISSPMPDSRVSSPAQGYRNKGKVDPAESSAASEMWDHLKTHKGLVVIGDILGFCSKPKKSRFIRIPGVDEESDKRFRGYTTANELLDNMQVDTKKLEDCALQIYRYHHGAQGDYGTYLDLESTIDEQSEDLEGFQDQRKNALILRTQLTVRVHAVIEKLLNSSGRELRRALFSLKQIFQDDKDLVHEFVNNDGLECLIKVGAEADQNYQNYILRALGQVMLYVDGMNGVINHNETVQWLYSLLSSKFRLVVKTALKLLLVFVEYTETNTQHLIRAINTVDNKRMVKTWTNIMTILDEKDGGDSELLVYAMTLVNKVVNAIPDQDTFYDVADAMEELGMERITYRHMNRKGADLDLLTQFQIYESALRAEDGEEEDIGQQDSLRRTPRLKSELDGGERKSLRYSTGPMLNRLSKKLDECPAEEYSQRKTKLKEQSAIPPEEHEQMDQMPDKRKRRSAFVQNQEYNSEGERYTNGSQEKSPSGDVVIDANNTDSSTNDNQHKKMGREPPDKPGPGQRQEEPGYQSDDHLHSLTDPNYLTRPKEPLSNNQRWALYRAAQKEQEEKEKLEEAQRASKPAKKSGGDTVTQRLENLRLQEDNSLPSTEAEINKLVGDSNKVKAELERITSPRDDHGPNRAAGPTGDRTGLISQAMENLTKKNEPVKPEPVAQKPDVKLTESDLQWDRLAKRLHRTLKIRDMDFTDLNSEDETDVFAPPPTVDFTVGVPPPPPPALGNVPPPPMAGPIPPPPPGGFAPPPPPPGGANPFQSAMPTVDMPPPPGANLKKNKKTMKLHWRTVQPEQPHPLTKGETIWKNIVPVKLDPDKIEHLFETRATDLKQKRAEAVGKKQITVLDPKRSNAINIGLTVLPPPRTIKTAILKMDNSIMNKEGIDKVLHTMIPTEEEKSKILEAQLANPDIPLGTAEQFLLTLSSISELQARLNVWLFKLEYETIESEVVEPLMDLKKGIEELLINKTLKYILSSILAIGNFLNGAQVRGFSIDYLTKVPEVKDTVHKHSLLHHLCTIILEQFNDSTDLYSEIGPITRCSRVDWDELHKKLDRLEVDCKASWDNLRAIVKHDGSSNLQLKSKMSEFISDAAERIMILQVIYKKVIHRYQKLLLYMGLPQQQARDLKVNQYCKIISEFALEYRTTREKVVQQLEKKANQRERKKTRGKMIVDMGKFKGSKNKKPVEEQGGDELQRVLANGYTSADDNGLPGRQTRRRLSTADNNSLRKGSVSGSRGCLTTDSEMYDTGDDEILEACVRTATTPSNRAPRERKRARNSRKSWSCQDLSKIGRVWDNM